MDSFCGSFEDERCRMGETEQRLPAEIEALLK